MRDQQQGQKQHAGAYILENLTDSIQKRIYGKPTEFGHKSGKNSMKK